MTMDQSQDAVSTMRQLRQKVECDLVSAAAATGVETVWGRKVCCCRSSDR